MRRVSISLALTLFFALAVIPGCSEDDPVAPQQDHFEAIGLVLYRSDVQILSILRGVTSDTLQAVSGATSEDYDVSFYDEDENIVRVEDDDETLGWEIGNASLVEVIQDSGKEGKFEFRLRGKAAGSTTIEFLILHEGHADFRSGKIPALIR